MRVARPARRSKRTWYPTLAAELDAALLGHAPRRSASRDATAARARPPFRRPRAPHRAAAGGTRVVFPAPVGARSTALELARQRGHELGEHRVDGERSQGLAPCGSKVACGPPSTLQVADLA
jgi:hypothetical protein